MTDTTTVPIETLLAHADWVRRLAHSLVRDPLAADDLVQETWLAALERPPSGLRAPRAWLAGVLRNRWRMRQRGEARRARREEARGAVGEAPAAADDVVARMETQRLLAEAVLALGEPERSTVLLRHVDGLSSAEIARRQGVPAATVRTRLRRGLARLRADLDRRHGGDRKRWTAALVPFLAPSGGEIGMALSFLQGVLLMKTSTKILLTALALLLLGAGIGGWALLTERGRHAGPDVASLSSAARGSPASPPPVLVGRPVEDATGSEAAPSTREAPVVPETRARFRARFLDEDARPVADVEVVAAHGAGPVDVVRADGDGTLRWTVDAGARSRMRTWHARAPGFAVHTFRTQTTGGADLDLGDIVLAPGADVAGVVIGPDGRPLGGARVVATGPQMASRHPRRAYVQGSIEHELGEPARTDEDGRFRLRGVPVGVVRLWSSHDDTRHAWSPALTLHGGDVVEGVRIEVTPGEPEDAITGVVLLPDGSRATDVRLRYDYDYDGGSGSATFLSEDGTFRIPTWAPGEVGIEAWTRDGTMRAAPLHGLRPGQHGLVLQLASPSAQVIRVVDEDGQPVTRYAVDVLSENQSRLLLSLPEAEHAEGRVEVALPPQTFRLRLEARGRERVVEGPYDPDRLPAVLEIRLRQVPGVEGMVRGPDGVLSGVRVRLHRVAREDEEIEHNGLRVRRDPWPDDEATTDAGGRFRLDVRKHGTFVVRADGEGLASAESDPLHLEPGRSAPSVTLTLGAGGGIRGRVIVPPSRRRAGIVVAASRADGYGSTVRTDAEGRFAFDRLMPGPWQVLILEEEIAPGAHSSSFSDGQTVKPLDWTCRVREGEVTSVDLALEGEPPTTVLQGELSLGGADPAGWTAYLHEVPTEALLGPALDRTALDDEGRFHLATDGEGERLLRVTAEGDEGLRTILAVVELGRGVNRWTLSRAVGDLGGRLGTTAAKEGELLLHVAALGPRAWLLTQLRPDADGRFEASGLPAGSGRVVRLDRDTQRRLAAGGLLSPDAWPTLAEVVVEAGGRVEVELP